MPSAISALQTGARRFRPLVRTAFDEDAVKNAHGRLPKRRPGVQGCLSHKTRPVAVRRNYRSHSRPSCNVAYLDLRDRAMMERRTEKRMSLFRDP
jgi:hypothetical protein